MAWDLLKEYLIQKAKEKFYHAMDRFQQYLLDKASQAATGTGIKALLAKGTVEVLSMIEPHHKAAVVDFLTSLFLNEPPPDVPAAVRHEADVQYIRDEPVVGPLEQWAGRMAARVNLSSLQIMTIKDPLHFPPPI